ncbi:MAG TPA: hypothetical protein VF748_13470 [Candidatus Acidoferrum sp.]
MRLVAVSHVGGFDHPLGAGLLFASVQAVVEVRKMLLETSSRS